MNRWVSDSRQTVTNGHSNGGNGNGRTYTSAQVTELVGISARQLYYWELKGIIRPIEVTTGARKFKRYTEKEIYILKKVKDYLDLGFTLSATFKKVEHLCRYFNGGNGRE